MTIIEKNGILNGGKLKAKQSPKRKFKMNR